MPEQEKNLKANLEDAESKLCRNKRRFFGLILKMLRVSFVGTSDRISRLILKMLRVSFAGTREESPGYLKILRVSFAGTREKSQG